MAASTASIAAIGSVVLTSTTLSSTSSFGLPSSLKLAPPRAAARVQRVVAARANLPEKESEQEQKSVTRRDVVANLLGAGAAMSFVGQALAANPGSVPRSLNVRKKEEKSEGKKE